jgi:hypothetical protein
VPGYSGTPLVKKLGIRPGFRVALRGAPADYADLVSTLPPGVKLARRVTRDHDLIHAFVDRAADLENGLPDWMERIRPDGMIWISWPKKASKVPTDVTEDVVRRVALPLGLVDVKVCAVTEVWSGLKLVIRKERRGRPAATSGA